MMPVKKENILRAFIRAYNVFPKEYKVKCWISLALLLVNSIVELIGLAVLIPLFSILLTENFINKNNAVNYIYNSLHFHNQDSFVLFVCAVVLMFIVFKGVVSIYINKYQSNFAFSLYSYFAVNLQKLHYSLGFLHFKEHNSAFLLRDINAMPIYFAQNFLLPIIMLLNEFIVISFLVITILFYNPLVVLLMLITILPISLIAYGFVKKKISGVGEKKANQAAEIHNTLQQSVHGYVDVKMTNTEAYFFSEYKTQVKEFTQVQTNSNILLSLPTKVVETGTFVGLIAFLLFSYFFIQDKEKISMLLGLFAISAFRILPSVNRIMASLLTIKEHQFSIDKIAQIKPEDNWMSYYRKENTIKELTFNDCIELNDINYFYKENETILDNFKINIKKGETIGIIGRSGSGKTTLINIILRFLKEKTGHILVDGVSLTDQNIDAWRKIIGFVQQDVYITDTTLAENIAFGISKKEIDQAKLKNCIEQASLSDLVARWPNGVNTKLGERGTKLSGGQRQRVGIARALYSNSKILLFDEATSALDNETEEEITEAIRKLTKNNLTMIIIAHRYTTLKYCDRIIELENGRVKGEHSYIQIMNKNNQKK
jgi:ABC-type multidrug transport system fused ATPase/permease subunit